MKTIPTVMVTQPMPQACSIYGMLRKLHLNLFRSGKGKIKKKKKMSKPHIVAIPYPAQGHVIPLLEFSQCLVNHGFKVTFVNTEHNDKRVMNALADESMPTSH